MGGEIMAQYTDFIPQNVALSGALRIAIRDLKGNRVGQIPLGALTPPNPRKRLYSYNAFSDAHIVSDTGERDLDNALTYADDNDDIAFSVICGDLTSHGTTEQLARYKAIVDKHKKPVYAKPGNHEKYRETSSGYLSQYTGHPLYYTFEYGGDVFIMVGVISDTEGNIFADGELQWLYETLEANRNKRCFLFEHIPPVECSGDVLGIYPYTKLRNHTESVVFKSLLRHYKNIVFFHGHTHMQFSMQEYGGNANYDNYFGIHSIHIPSLSVPRNVNADGTGYTTLYAESEGYVVDVYENGIHLRGRDFVKGEFLPIASYWLDTTLKTVEAGTYTDPTGTITT